MKIELHDTFRILEPIYSSSFLCWPCNSCFSKHYFIDIFADECGWQSYSCAILLRSVLRTAQILILNKNGSRAIFSCRFSLLQGSVLDPIFGSGALGAIYTYFFKDKSQICAYLYFSGKIVSAQWFSLVSVYSRAQHPDLNFGFQSC